MNTYRAVKYNKVLENCPKYESNISVCNFPIIKSKLFHSEFYHDLNLNYRYRRIWTIFWATKSSYFLGL